MVPRPVAVSTLVCYHVEHSSSSYRNACDVFLFVEPQVTSTIISPNCEKHGFSVRCNQRIEAGIAYIMTNSHIDLKGLVEESKIKGLGVFANQDFGVGEEILEIDDTHPVEDRSSLTNEDG